MAETRCRRTDHKEKCESVLLLNQDLTPKSCHACDSHCEYMTAAVMEAVRDESDNLASRSSIDCSPPSRGQSFAPPANLSLKILNIAGLQLQRTNLIGLGRKLHIGNLASSKDALCSSKPTTSIADRGEWPVATAAAASDRLISVSLGAHDGVVIIGAGAAQHCGDLGHHRSRHATSVSASRVRRLRLSQAGRRGTGLSVAEEKETTANVSPALCARAIPDTRREPSGSTPVPVPFPSRAPSHQRQSDARRAS